MQTQNDDTIQTLLDEHERVVVLFGASWCAPCKRFKPTFEKLAAENSDVTFAYCDVDETEQLAMDLEIKSVPTVVSFFSGIEDETVVGANIDKVKVLLEKLRARVKRS
jgi:thioredoxin-like negative regulator of GroEL